MSTLRRDWHAWLCLISFALPVFVFACIKLALAAPPPGSDPNSALAAWYHSLTVPDNPITRANGSANGGCCAQSDCRPVDYRQDDQGYLVLIGTQFPGVTEPHWERVPPEVVILHKDNPEGQPVACWYNQKLRCFVPPSET